MERENDFVGKVQKALLSNDSAFEPPYISTMRGARQIVAARAVSKERPDYLTVLMQFLNLRVKLYHIVLTAIVIWFCYLFTQKKTEQKPEISSTTFSYGLASTTNNTVLCSIGTCIKK